MRRHYWLLLLVGVLVVGCAGSSRAPVESRHGEVRTRAKPDSHMVVKGDTLYSIAWRYGIDYRTLAAINGVSSPYTIYPGQQLRLRGKPQSRSASKVETTPAPAQARTSSAPAAAPAPAASKPAPSTAVTKASPQRGTTGATPEPNAIVARWSWPTDGKVVRKFSGTVHKGIDIDGDAGDRVRATAAGKIVYAGSGIVGYGKLLIVKHNAAYLSAYGHNRRLLVREGETVSAGQVIAEKGSSATNSVKLHFEIRREGKPVDPLKLLPRG